MHLRFDCLWAPYNDVKQGHPQQVMMDMGITYQYATPQSIADQWWFWNCENVPNDLPPFLEKMDNDPMECIGYGLSCEDAEKIRDYGADGRRFS